MGDVVQMSELNGMFPISLDLASYIEIPHPRPVFSECILLDLRRVLQKTAQIGFTCPLFRQRQANSGHALEERSINHL